MDQMDQVKKAIRVDHATEQFFIAQCHKFAADTLQGFNYDEQLEATLAFLTPKKESSEFIAFLSKDNLKLLVLKKYVSNVGNLLYAAKDREQGRHYEDMHELMNNLFWHQVVYQSDKISQTYNRPAVSGISVCRNKQEVEIRIKYYEPEQQKKEKINFLLNQIMR